MIVSTSTINELATVQSFITKRNYFSRVSHYRRHNIALDHMQAGLSPTLSIISQVLDLPVKVSQYHFDLCVQLVSNPVTLNLPKPNTEHVIPFSLVAGPEIARSSKKARPGCYRIYSPNTPSNLSYIGQTIHLGNRVKDHAKGHNASTAAFVSLLGESAKVDLYLIPQDLELNGLSLQQFMCVLEQYLFFKFRPTQNKTFVATAGVMLRPESIEKIRKERGNVVYVYEKVEWDRLTLLHIFGSNSMIGPLLGFNRSWVKTLTQKSSGWFRNTLLFSTKEMGKRENVTINLLSLEQLKNLVLKVQLTPVYTTGNLVHVTNILTNETTSYGSKKEAARSMQADESTFRNNRDNLFRRIYLIYVDDKN